MLALDSHTLAPSPLSPTSAITNLSFILQIMLFYDGSLMELYSVLAYFIQRNSLAFIQITLCIIVIVCYFLLLSSSPWSECTIMFNHSPIGRHWAISSLGLLLVKLL